MKELLNEIAKGLKDQVAVEVFWGYDSVHDTYSHHEWFGENERIVSTLEKINSLPKDAEIDEIVDDDGIRYIGLK